MIEIKNVDVVKSGLPLFKGFSWKIEAGEHWVITGRNGSGKTILLELLAGNIHAAHGEIHYDFIQGATWDERFQERKEKIHYIPAHAIQTFIQSQELFYQQRYYSIGDERIPLVKDIFGDDIHKLHSFSFPPSFTIDALLELELTRLSNGQLKKVLILKNLVKQLPQVLLFDYPFEGLDHDSRWDLIRFMDHLVKTYGIQLILVDQHHHLPSVINRKLIIDDFKMVDIQTVDPSADDSERKAIRKNTTGTQDIPVVEMRNLTIRYGEKVIIKNLNWTICRGDRWALMGKNGSGKTTLFSLIFADHPMAYSQEVYLFGKRRGTGESIWDIKNRVNYLGPELISYLNPKSISLTAREYIRSQHKQMEEEALQLILFFNAAHFMNKAVKYLSAGQLQLMLLINYFLSDKELLLLDEPFQFLDAEQKDRVNEYLQLHLNKDITLVLITHYEADMTRWTAQTMFIG